MPIHACTLPNGSSGFQWGKSGKCYASRKDAEAQATAIYASGWVDKLLSNLRPSVQKVNLKNILMKQQDLDHAAHDAATSPHNLRSPPTDAQTSAGNYKKGKISMNGLDISIENPAGSKRKPELPTLQSHYGYIRGSKGADGDQVDIFLRPGTPVDWDGDVYIIDQIKADGSFDEHKCLFGWDSVDDAKKAYLSNYEPKWQGFGGITTMTQNEFKAWMDGDTTQPLTKEDGGGAPTSTTTTGHTQSNSATSGITAYTVGNERRQRRRVKLKAKENRNG